MNLDWHDTAACADTAIEVFFGPEGTGPGRPSGWSPDQAKSICLTCPVSPECLEYALDHQIDYGVFGGATSDERRRIMAARRWNMPAACGTRAGYERHRGRRERPCDLCREFNNARCRRVA